MPKGTTHRTGCVIDGCERKHGGHGYCRVHLYRWRQNGDPLVTRKPGPPPGESNPSWRGENVGYPAVHARLRRLQGPASDHTCITCGSAAEEWAYQHTAPDERISEATGLPYTTDLAHYAPMCLSCHHQFDKMHGWVRPARFGRGVSFHKSTRKWRAYVTVDRKQRHLGLYEDEALAKRVASEARERIALGRFDALLDQLDRLA